MTWVSLWVLLAAPVLLVALVLSPVWLVWAVVRLMARAREREAAALQEMLREAREARAAARERLTRAFLMGEASTAVERHLQMLAEMRRARPPRLAEQPHLSVVASPAPSTSAPTRPTQTD